MLDVAKRVLKLAYAEHINRHNLRRAYPEEMVCNLESCGVRNNVWAIEVIRVFKRNQ